MSTDIFKIIFGSRLYGTATSESDTDYKRIFIPSAEDILLLQAKDTMKFGNNNKCDGKNNKLSVDDDAHSLSSFLYALASGHTWALDALFAPKAFFVHGHDHPVFRLIKSHKDKILSRSMTGFIGYCQSQVNLFGDKRKNQLALDLVIDFLSQQKPELSIGETTKGFLHQAKEDGLWGIITTEIKPNGQDFRLTVSGKSIGSESSVANGLKTFVDYRKGYRNKTEIADQTPWKLLYHAVRVAKEAQELLLTGHITFPRPEGQLLLDIRRGEMPLPAIQEMIDQGLKDVLAARNSSPLRPEPDHNVIKQIIIESHSDVITEHILKTADSRSKK